MATRNRGLTLICSMLVALSMLPGLAPRAAAQQETEPQMVAALRTINLYRSWLGIAPLTVDPALQRAAEAHVEYYRLNFGDPNLSGMGLHNETPGKPGFTGVTFQDRAVAAGYTGWVNENAGLSGSMTWSLDWFINTIGHRLTLLDPRYTNIGLAAINEGDKKFEIIDLGSGPNWQDTVDNPSWAAWPPNGVTGVPLSFAGEAPNPFPSASYPVGSPITLKYFGAGALELTSATISTGGQAVPSFATVGNGWLSSNTVQLAANTPLEPGTIYDVRVTGRANGTPFERVWSFTTTQGDDPLALGGAGGVPPSAPLPPGLAAADPLVQQLWVGSDGPVASGAVARSWLWGPDVWLGTAEPSAESPNGVRQVYYLDKARVEINTADAPQPYVTAGLLVRDMIAGVVQVGRDEYERSAPANVQLAGDPLKDNPDAPTYASLNGLASIVEGRAAEPRGGQRITDVLRQDGTLTRNDDLGALASYGTWEPTLGHNIAAVFDPYLAALPTDWRTSVGLPLSEPYWVQTRVAGDNTWVLVQAFERRLLTYTPTNAPNWRIEMGNIGRHYYTWRYGQEPPGAAP